MAGRNAFKEGFLGPCVVAFSGLRQYQVKPAALLALGIFSMLASPAFVFAARVAQTSFLAMLEVSLAFVFVVFGLGVIAACVVLGGRGARFPSFAGYLVMCTVVATIGGLVLALAPDTTVFLSTLVGAMVGIIVTKMETLISQPQSREDVPRRLTARRRSPSSTRRITRRPRQS